MATVYRAYDKELDREVALKHIEASRNQQIVERFFREFEAAKKLEHENIIGLYEIEEIEDGCFFTMELIEGPTLRERLKKSGSLTLAEALTVFRQIINALIALHQENIVHRDLKPANILFTCDGRAVLADFGLARDLDITSMTETGVILGTPSYMCPEQIRTSEVDGRSDIYQLGLIFYEMVTGKLPFAQGDMPTLFNRILHDEVKPLKDVEPGVPSELSRLISKCVAKDPSCRFPSTIELLRALNEIENSDESVEQTARKKQERAVIVFLLFTIFVMVLIGLQRLLVKETEIRNSSSSAPVNLVTLLRAKGNTGVIELPKKCFSNETIAIKNESVTLVGKKGSAIEFKCAPAFVLSSSSSLSLDGLNLSAGSGTMISVVKGKLSVVDCRLVANGEAISAAGRDSHLQVTSSEVAGKGACVISIRDGAKASLMKVKVRAPLAKHGVDIFKGSHVALSQCDISLCQRGLVVYSSGKIKWQDSEILSCKDCGVLLRGCDDFFAKNCRISDCSAVGMEIRGGAPKIEGLQVTSSEVCLKLVDQCKANIVKSSFVGGCGSVVYNSTPIFENCIFEKNSSSGMKVFKSGHPVIKSSQFIRNGLHGVEISGGCNVSILRCSFNDNKGYGCRTKGRVSIRHSKFHQNGLTGFAARSNSMGTIAQTISSQHDGYGFDIGGQSNYSIVDCELRNNDKANMRVCPLAIVKCAGSAFIESKSNGVTCLAVNKNLFEKCRFIGNAFHGLKITAGTHLIKASLFRENSKGLYLNGADALVTECSFINNSGFHLIVKNGLAKVIACEFSGLPEQRALATMGSGKIDLSDNR